MERVYRLDGATRVPRGNWKWKVYDPLRHPKTKTVNLRTKDKAAALRLANERVRQMAVGAYDPWVDAAPRKGVLFADAVTEFLQEKESSGASPSTVETDRGHLDRLCRSLGAGFLVQHVESSHIQSFLDAPKKDGSARSSTYKGRILASLQHFFNWAITKGVAKENPAEGAAAKGPAGHPREDITEEEEAAILEAARASASPLLPNPGWVEDWVVFACRTGLRPGEQRQLRWHAVDIERGLIHVGRGHRVKTPNSVRTVPVPSRALSVLRRLSQAEPVRDELVFRGGKGGEVATAYLTKRLQGLAEAAGIEKPISAYSTRHAYGTRLVQNGVPAWNVAELMGTSVAMIEKHYGHHDPKRSAGHVHRVFE